MISAATERLILRWVHIVISIPIYGYIYSPFDQLPKYAHLTRWYFFPTMVLSGIWMWKGHLVRKFFSRRAMQQRAIPGH